MSRPRRDPPHPIHEVIRREAERLRRLPRGGCSPAHEVPELAALLNAARAAVDASLPAGFEFHGRRYFLRSVLVVRLEVFDSPAEDEPLVRGVSLSSEGFGHVPGH
jgi:hypothetical protein